MLKTLTRPRRTTEPPEESSEPLRKSPATRQGNFHKFVAAALGLQIFTALGVLLLGMGYLRLSSRPPVLVERANGESFQAEQQDPDYRDSKAIQEFVETMYGSLYNWSKVTTTKGGFKAETGYQRGKVNIPLRMAAAEFGLSPEGDFRAGVLDKLAKSYGRYARSVQAGDFSQLINIREVSDPMPLEDGGWKVSIVSDLIITSRTARPENIPLNQTVYISPDHRDKLPDPTNEFEAHRNEIRAYGLLIYAIRDIEVDDPTAESRAFR
ncbi:hypothetical protein C1752_10587 [Acaryochloris thomasi RCC1774]|uniref:Bacterial virulence protein VirB8 domain-containing protein n=1 Tax=Acaryochloris thomasi RCC1774 TaxID=1764569 RepID=A0A2W1J8C9_9CYAN|nr:hypothetical protein [Acaryochloris thomasi]PZD70580.1 hypothetical protein C1752_10587 [Acaryochloris thomasi RCC1774]